MCDDKDEQEFWKELRASLLGRRLPRVLDGEREDIVHETIARTIARTRVLPRVRSLKAMSLAIWRVVVLDRLRKASRRPWIATDPAVLDHARSDLRDPSAPTPGVPDSILTNRQLEDMRALRCHRPDSLAELAGVLGIARQTVTELLACIVRRRAEYLRATPQEDE